MFRTLLISAAVGAATLFSLPDTSDAARVRVWRGPHRAGVAVRGPYRSFRYRTPYYRRYNAPRYYGYPSYRYPAYGYSRPYWYGGGGVYYNGPRTNFWFRY